MNNIQIFTSPQFGEIRTMTMSDGQIGFIGKDIAEALGYSNASKAVIMHVDDDDKVEALVYLNSQNGNAGQHRKVTFINESGIYALVLSSKLPKAREFRHWVTSEVLPSIRKTGQYAIGQNHELSETYVRARFAAIDCARKYNLVSEVSVAAMANKVLEELGLQTIDYVEQKEGAIHSATELLKTHNSPMSIYQFNKAMIEKGFLVEKSYKKSNQTIGKYKTLTKEGLVYGKNDVSPKNELVTQPHYYDDKFEELLGILN